MDYFFIAAGFVYLVLFGVALRKGSQPLAGSMHVSANVMFAAGFLISLLNEILSKL